MAGFSLPQWKTSCGDIVGQVVAGERCAQADDHELGSQDLTAWRVHDSDNGGTCLHGSSRGHLKRYVNWMEW